MPAHVAGALLRPHPVANTRGQPHMTYEIDCAVCGRRFTAARSYAETCGTTCRVRRFRERKAQHAVTAAALLAEQARLAREAAASLRPTDPERERLIAELRRLADVAERTAPAL